MTWTNTKTQAYAKPERGHELRVAELEPGVWWWSAWVGLKYANCGDKGDPGSSKTAAKRKAVTAYKKIAAT